jgi:hypothetical protein
VTAYLRYMLSGVGVGAGMENHHGLFHGLSGTIPDVGELQ